MSASPQYNRALILHSQRRHADAERELRSALAQDPRDAQAHAMLAICLAEQMQLREATAEAQQAIGLEPDLSFAHYAMARVWMDRHRPGDAATAINEAIRIDPQNPDYWSMLAAIRFEQRSWPAALEAAERGLAIDSEHEGCTNLRAMALVKLGRRGDAGATIHAALNRNPESAITHANEGWRLLHLNQPKPAMIHFREALRLDPSLDWARAGIVEALKARNFVYRWILMYFLFMARLGRRVQWAILIGGYVGYRLLTNLADQNPAVAPYVRPILYTYIAFALLTWLADPVFNLLLRLHPIGKYALSPDQRMGANLVAGVFVVAAICGVVALRTGSIAAIAATIMVVFLLIPVSAIFRCSDGWPRLVMFLIALVLFLVLLGSTGVLYLYERGDPRDPSLGDLGETLFTVYAYSTLGAQFAANYLAQVRPKR